MIKGLKLEDETFSVYSKFFLTWIFSISGSLAVLMLMISGFRYLSSKGKPKEIKKAKEKIQQIFLGLVLIFVAWVLVSFVMQEAVFQWTLEMKEDYVSEQPEVTHTVVVEE